MIRIYWLLALLYPWGGALADEVARPAGREVHAGHAGHPAARSWTHSPLLVRTSSQGMNARSEVLMSARNLEPDLMLTYSPDGAPPREPTMTLGGARIEARPGVGNYYWITARAASPHQVTVASTSHYFSNPGPAPTTLLLTAKHELELIPQPLPREHSGYRANETWRFLLRFNGSPLTNQPLTLETQNGSTLDFTSDAQGYAEVRFPDDFKPEAAEKPANGEHGHGPRRAGFVLTTAHHHGSIHYLTSFNASYGQDAYTGRNLALGLGLTLLGMACGAPLLRHKRKIPPASDMPQTPTGA